MAHLDEFGREILDQTPVSIPFRVDRPEPIHLRMRRLAMEALATVKGDDVETLEEANDFVVPDDPSSFDSEFTEPDYMPSMSETKGSDFTTEEVEAAKQAILSLRQQKNVVPSSAPNGAASVENGPKMSSSETVAAPS